MTNKKHILLVLGLVILLFSLTAISAAQQDGNQTITKTADQTSTKTAQPTVTKTAEPTKQVETKTPEKNITKKKQKNLFINISIFVLVYQLQYHFYI